MISNAKEELDAAVSKYMRKIGARGTEIQKKKYGKDYPKEMKRRRACGKLSKS